MNLTVHLKETISQKPFNRILKNMTDVNDFEIIELTPRENDLINPTGENNGKYVRAGLSKIYLPREIQQYASIFRNFEVRPDDVWLYGYTRSGTTLTQELLWLIGNNLNFEKAAETVMDLRFPYMEGSLFRNDENKDEFLKLNKSEVVDKKLLENLTVPIHQILNETKERRFIKSHLPFSYGPANLLESGCKVVYVARNPKDVIVSNYFYPQSFGKPTDFKSFWKLVKNDLVMFAPIFVGLKEGWKLRNHKNVLFLFYEDIIKDKRAAIQKIAKFMDIELTEEQLAKLVEHVDIKNFKKNKSVNNDHLVDLGVFIKNDTHQFIRTGKSGGWKNYFTGDLEKEVNEWIAENLKGTDIILPEV